MASNDIWKYYALGYLDPDRTQTKPKDVASAVSALGIKNFNSRNDYKQVNELLSGYNKSKDDPLYSRTAQQLGITAYNSPNDYNQVLNRLSGASSQSASAVPTAAPAVDQGKMNAIQTYYKAYLGRDAQQNEKDYWYNNEANWLKIGDSIRNSEEGKKFNDYLMSNHKQGALNPYTASKQWDPVSNSVQDMKPQQQIQQFQLPQLQQGNNLNGGDNSAVEDVAPGFRRARSSARLAGLTSRGTSQFKISGQSGRSSGVNTGM